MYYIHDKGLLKLLYNMSIMWGYLFTLLLMKQNPLFSSRITHLSIFLLIIYPSIYLFNLLSIHSSILFIIYLSFCLAYLPIDQAFYLSIYLSIYLLSIHLSIYLLIIYTSIYLFSYYLSIYLSYSSDIYLTISFT